MSLFARVLGFFCGLILLAIGLGGLWLTWGPGSFEIAGRASRLSVQLATEQLTRGIVTAGFAVFGVLALALIIEALRPRRRHLIQLRAGEHESVLIAPSELERQLEAVARDAERVADARAHVRPASDHTVAVDMALNVEPDAEVGSVVSESSSEWRRPWPHGTASP